MTERGSYASFFSPPSASGRERRTAVRAHGTTIEFADGTRAVDGTSGLWNVNLGYGNPTIAAAVHDALLEASYLSLFRYGHRHAGEASEALLRAARIDGGRVFFSTAGGAALDAALKTVRQYWALRGEPQRNVVVGLRGSYHGMTFGAMGLTGEELGQAGYGVDRKLVRHVDVHDAASLRRLLDIQGGRIAAVVLEPVLGSGAIEVDRELVDAALKAQRDTGLLVVADEVATGFGRTGSMFASDTWASQPDLLLTSKGLTNGTCAASAVLWSRRVVEAYDEHDAVLLHGETQAGSPSSCAAILATLQQFAQLDALGQGVALAARLDGLLHDLAAAHPSVERLDGRGLFRGVRLSDAGVAWAPDRVAALVDACLAAGAVVHPGPSCVQLVPALVMEPDTLQRLVGILDQELALAERGARAALAASPA